MTTTGKRLGLVALLTAVLIAAVAMAVALQQAWLSPAHAQGDDAGVNTITVQGTGSVSTNPDWSVVQIGVEKRAQTVEEAQAAAAEAIAGIKEALLANGVEADNIHTSAFHVNPDYRYTEEGGQQLHGYVVTHLLNVEYGQLDAVGKLIDEAAAAGANRINNVHFTLQDDSELETQALKNAVAHARKKAEALAEAAGKEIVDIHSIVESPAQVYHGREMMQLANSDSAAGTSIEVGSVDVYQSVNITYTIR